MLTRVHFQMIAETIRDMRLPCMREDQIAVRDELMRDMADVLATTNPLFDRSRFYAACQGVQK